MIVKFDRSFDKSLNELRNSQVASRIIKLIEQLKNADDLKGISNVKKLKGYQNYYRVRLGDYRLVLEQRGGSAPAERLITLIVVAHRKDIYNLLP